jgi:hypothetical protein
MSLGSQSRSRVRSSLGWRFGACKAGVTCSWAQTWPRSRGRVNGVPRGCCRVFVGSKLTGGAGLWSFGSWARHTTELLGFGAILSCSCMDARKPDDLNCHCLGLASGTMTKATCRFSGALAATGCQCRNDRSLPCQDVSQVGPARDVDRQAVALIPSSSKVDELHNFHQRAPRRKA